MQAGRADKSASPVHLAPSSQYSKIDGNLNSRESDHDIFLWLHVQMSMAVQRTLRALQDEIRDFCRDPNTGDLDIEKVGALPGRVSLAKVSRPLTTAPPGPVAAALPVGIRAL